ncbi:hypothetical protein LDENG_00277530, partial [Lucifuga dentata]
MIVMLRTERQEDMRQREQVMKSRDRSCMLLTDMVLKLLLLNVYLSKHLKMHIFTSGK